jgi:hypothetical protein
VVTVVVGGTTVVFSVTVGGAAVACAVAVGGAAVAWTVVVGCVGVGAAAVVWDVVVSALPRAVSSAPPPHPATTTVASTAAAVIKGLMSDPPRFTKVLLHSKVPGVAAVLRRFGKPVRTAGLISGQTVAVDR